MCCRLVSIEDISTSSSANNFRDRSVGPWAIERVLSNDVPMSPYGSDIV